MREFAAEMFSNYAFIIVFIHVLGAIVWVGGMIAMRVAVHPAMQHIEDEKVRLARSLEAVRGLFALALPFIVLLLLTGLVMALAIGSAGGPLMHVKEAIWTIMTINYALMVRRRNLAERRFISGDLAGASGLMEAISKYMLPINILLGIVALAAGVTLRGF